MQPEVEQTLNAIMYVQQKCSRAYFGLELAAIVDEIREGLGYAPFLESMSN